MTTLALTFNFPLSPNYIYHFRGAFIDLIRKSNLNDYEKQIFGNREIQSQNSNIYIGSNITQYPRIQYRVVNGHAAICALNEGVEVMEKLIQADVLERFTIQGQNIPLLPLTWTRKTEHAISIVDGLDYEYIISDYIPFHHKSDHEYHKLPTFHDKINLLNDKISHGISLSLIELNVIQSREFIRVEILDFISKGSAGFKTKDESRNIIKNYTKKYTLQIRSNILLPDGFSIGLNKAYGYGVINRIQNNVH